MKKNIISAETTLTEANAQFTWVVDACRSLVGCVSIQKKLDGTIKPIDYWAPKHTDQEKPLLRRRKTMILSSG